MTRSTSFFATGATVVLFASLIGPPSTADSAPHHDRLRPLLSLLGTRQALRADGPDVAAGQAKGAPMQLTRDLTFRVVLNLRTPAPTSQRPDAENVGTGIFIVHGSEPYILTASHVARGCNAGTKVLVSDADSTSKSLSLRLFNPQLNWKHHPVADVSVLRVVPDESIVPHLQGRFLPSEQLNFTRDLPSRDTYLTAVGFPMGLGATGHFSPFTFTSHASSALITMPRADTNSPQDFFILENPGVGGYSGGPVFDLGYVIVGAMTTNTGPTICHGIMHGTISDATGGKLAAVTPTFYVKGLL